MAEEKAPNRTKLGSGMAVYKTGSGRQLILSKAEAKQAKKAGAPLTKVNAAGGSKGRDMSSPANRAASNRKPGGGVKAAATKYSNKQRGVSPAAMKRGKANAAKIQATHNARGQKAAATRSAIKNGLYTAVGTKNVHRGGTGPAFPRSGKNWSGFGGPSKKGGGGGL
jgi:hypothetical protein